MTLTKEELVKYWHWLSALTLSVAAFRSIEQVIIVAVNNAYHLSYASFLKQVMRDWRNCPSNGNQTTGN